MPKTAHALTSIARVQQQASRESSHVWISEHLLNDTFERFQRNHPRHGSSVPGPLEARRRSRGRKATSVAYGANATSIPDLLSWNASYPQRATWWERIGITGKRQEVPQYQPWVRIGPPPPVPQPEAEYTQSIAERKISVSGSSDERYRKVMRSMLGAQNLTDIRRLVDEHAINLQSDPKRADGLFDCMLEKRRPLEQLSEFLLDPAFNPPGSSNHLRFCRHLLAHTWDPEVRLKGFQVVAKAIEQGMMGTEHLRRILLAGFNPALSHGLDWAQIALEFLDAVSTSKVLKMKELGSAVFKSLGKAARKSPFTAGTPSLLYRLNDVQGMPEIENVESVILDALTISAAQGRSNAQILQVIREWPLSASIMPRAHKVTRTLHLSRLASPVSEKDSQVDSRHDADIGLLSDNDPHIEIERPMSWSPLDKTITPHTAIDLWYTLLRDIASGPLEEHESPAAPFSPEWLEDWVLYAWTACAVSVHAAESHINHVQISLQNSLSTAFSQSKLDDNGTAAAELVAVIERLNMPQHTEFAKQLDIITKSLFGHSIWSDTTSVKSALDAKRLDVLADTRFYQVASKHFPRSLAAVCEDINRDLHRFEILSRELLTMRKDFVIVLIRLLRHNHALKTALAHSWSDAARADLLVKGDAAEHSIPGYARGMLARLALSCARSPLLHPRQAVRQVEYIMSLLHASGAPLQKEVAQALWHAAITRQNGGSSTEQIHWVLDKMKWIMGEDFLAAASRLTSGDYYEVEKLLFGAEVIDVLTQFRDSAVSRQCGPADGIFEWLESLLSECDESRLLSGTPPPSSDTPSTPAPKKELLEELASVARSKSTATQANKPQNTIDSTTDTTTTTTSIPPIPWHSFTRAHALANPHLTSQSRGTERYVFRFLPRGPFLGSPQAQAEAQAARAKYRHARKKWEAKRCLPDYADKRFQFEASLRSQPR